MKAIVGTLVIVLLVEVLGAIACIYSGIFNVAANDPHWSITHAVLERARVRSIKVQAAGIKPPDNLSEHPKVVAGTSHFAEHCSSCHTAPGVEASELTKGMYPKPPALTGSAKQWSPGELFWIIRNGIKMSGMPAWPDHSDEDIWSIVAFLGKFPNMSEQDYGNLVKESMEAGGHKTHGGPDAGAECMPKHRAAGHC